MEVFNVKKGEARYIYIYRRRLGNVMNLKEKRGSKEEETKGAAPKA